MSPNFRCETGGVDSVNNYKIGSTVDSLYDEKLYTSNNLDFSGFSVPKNNFSRKYSNILNEFSPSLEKNSTIEFKQRLNLMCIQSKLENRRKTSSHNFSNKMQDIKFNYLTQDQSENNYYISKSPLKTISGLDGGCNKYLIII